MASKYGRRDEIKFRDMRPTDGQEIALRLAGMKTYWRARYKGPDHAELYGKDGNLNGSVVQVYAATSAAGWCPVTPNALLGLLPAGTLIERSFEFDDRTRENIPTITLRLPRCAASDTRSWEERDRLAAALTDLLPNASFSPGEPKASPSAGSGGYGSTCGGGK